MGSGRAFLSCFRNGPKTAQLKNKRVAFADEKSKDGKVGNLQNIFYFDENDEPIACNLKFQEILKRNKKIACSIKAAGITKLCSAEKSTDEKDERSRFTGISNRTRSLFSNSFALPAPMPILPFPTMTSNDSSPAKGRPGNMGRAVRSFWLVFEPNSDVNEKQPVRLAAISYKESVSMLTGTVRVNNLAFKKEVFVRYTVDNWLSYRDLPAQYAASPSLTHDDFVFSFPIPISLPHGRKVAFAVCYRVAGQEHWDNNDGQNYEGRVVYITDAPRGSRRDKQPSSKAVLPQVKTGAAVSPSLCAAKDAQPFRPTGVHVAQSHCLDAVPSWRASPRYAPSMPPYEAYNPVPCWAASERNTFSQPVVVGVRGY